MVKLKRLKIDRYRNVEPCELIFSDRRNVLLGPNGAGKTTLLSLISKILRTNLADPGDPFSIELELTFPQGTLTGTISSREPDVEPAELLRLPPMVRAGREGAYAPLEMPDFQLTLSLSHLPATASIRRSEDQLTIEGADLDSKWPARVAEGPQGLLHTILTLVTVASKVRVHVNVRADLWSACRFDESLDMFRAFTARPDDVDLSKDDLRPRIRLDRFRGRPQAGSPSAINPDHGIVPKGILDAMQRGLPEGATDYSMEDNQIVFLSESVRLLEHRSRWNPEESTEEKRNRKGARGARGRQKLSRLWFLAPLAPLRFFSFPHSLPLELASRQRGRASQLIEFRKLSICSVL